MSVACAVKNGKNDAPDEYLEPAGWVDIEQTLKGNSFAEYVTATHQLVAEHRVYFDTANAVDVETELLAVTPKEYAPVAKCSDDRLALSLEQYCYLATVLVLEIF